MPAGQGPELVRVEDTVADQILRSVVPFIDGYPPGAAVPGEAAKRATCGATPLGQLADPVRRGELADRLAASVVRDWPSTPLGELAPVLADLGEERITTLRVHARLYRVLHEQVDAGPCWAGLAGWSVTELLQLRNVGILMAHRLVAACLDHAIRVSLPHDRRWDLRRCLAELPGVLDDRRWLVLAARQLSWHGRPARSQLAAMVGVSRNRIAELEHEAATRLREALDDRDFQAAAHAAHKLRVHLGEGPIPLSDLELALDAVIPPRQLPLDAPEREVLLWCAGPYEHDDGSLVLRGRPGPAVRYS